MKVSVLHAYYGCDTGCCGHVVEIDDEQVGEFQLSEHPEPGQDRKAWAKELVESVLRDKYPDCLANIN